jgi:hypothetical protein
MNIARIAGDTETHPFLPADTFTLTPAPAGDADTDALRALLDSHFTPTQWEIRRDASHAKSKTHPPPIAGG